jgi:hypothetical protein
MKLIHANSANRYVDLDDGLDEHVDRRFAVSSRIKELRRSSENLLFWRRKCRCLEVSMNDDSTHGVEMKLYP